MAEQLLLPLSGFEKPKSENRLYTTHQALYIKFLNTGAQLRFSAPEGCLDDNLAQGSREEILGILDQFKNIKCNNSCEYRIHNRFRLFNHKNKLILECYKDSGEKCRYRRCRLN